MDPLKPHALILDPDPSIRVLLAAVLQRSGVEATICNTACDSADHALRRGPYAVVVISSDMPRFAALLQQIHQTPAGHRPKVIIITTSEITLPPTDAEAVLMKPLHLWELYAALAAYCGDGGRQPGHSHARPAEVVGDTRPHTARR